MTDVQKAKGNILVAMQCLMMAEGYLAGVVADLRLEDKVDMDEYLDVLRKSADGLEVRLEAIANLTYRRDLGLTGR